MGSIFDYDRETWQEEVSRLDGKPLLDRDFTIAEAKAFALKLQDTINDEKQLGTAFDENWNEEQRKAFDDLGSELVRVRRFLTVFLNRVK